MLTVYLCRQQPGQQANASADPTNPISKHTGLAWHYGTKKWRVTLDVSGQHVFVGSFPCESVAAAAYDAAAYLVKGR